MLSSTLPIALDGTLPACLTIRSQVSSQETPKNTSEYAPKYTSKSLASTHSRGMTLAISLDYAPMYAPACSIQRLAELQKPGTGRREACGVWCVADGGRRMVAEIMTSVDSIV